MKISMHLKIVKVKQITKPKNEVLDSKQAFMWVVDTHVKEEVSRSVKKSTTFLAILSQQNLYKKLLLVLIWTYYWNYFFTHKY